MDKYILVLLTEPEGTMVKKIKFRKHKIKSGRKIFGNMEEHWVNDCTKFSRMTTILMCVSITN